MQGKLFPNIHRFTTAFWVSIVCVTATALMLRLTVFSDMAVAPENTGALVQSAEDESFLLSSRIHFLTPSSKGDLFLSNLYEDKVIKVNIVLADTGDSILSTGFINPNSSLQSYGLNPLGMQLEDGVYDCVAEVTAYQEGQVTTALGTTELEIEVLIGEKPKRSK